MVDANGCSPWYMLNVLYTGKGPLSSRRLSRGQRGGVSADKPLMDLETRGQK